MGKLSIDVTLQMDKESPTPNRRAASSLPQLLPPLAPTDRWYDGQWLLRRSRQDFTSAPLSIYRFSPLGWYLDETGNPLSWMALIDRLLPYVADLGFTHIALTDVNVQHVNDEAFATFILACHESDIGVILDWNVASDTPYATGDDSQTFAVMLHQVLEWVERYHLDGLHLKERAEQTGDGLIEHLIQGITKRRHDVLILIDRPVDMPVHLLTRVLICNTHWSRNTLNYLSVPTKWRGREHHLLHESLGTAFNMHFLLPLLEESSSHEPQSWFDRMPGDPWQKFANLRAAMSYMWAHPGKKLLGMGSEFAQGPVWQPGRSLDWGLLDQTFHAGMLRLVADLNRLYGNESALYECDIESSSFTWVIGDDVTNSVIAFLRYGAEGTAPLLVVINFTPNVLENYRIGVPTLGAWHEVLNSDSVFYGGSNVGNANGVEALLEPSHGYPVSISLTLPPLAALFLRQGDWPA
ncbi:alpha amylase C-terminal domain-containing protein [Halomonas sp. PR-M31]|uniref:alpha amylase C-terminal domain-containing protein n=1 Tax=Halomonas sp. PR-M31 TaxID=1471202 RepID=UPI000651D366|nr:alpha amylase C-terminal domain-containing protein [Halomonas sp. PR-M31]